MAPGNHESAGKKKYEKGKREFSCKDGIVRSGLGNARSGNTRLATKFWKIASRRGKKKACMAIARNILVIRYYMLKNKQIYKEGGLRILTLTG